MLDLWTVVLSPILLAQGQWVRFRTPKLPEAPGPRLGQLGSGAPLSLLILGDSAAAGVGIEHQTQALSGQLAQQLKAQFGLQWQLHARSGLTTKDAQQLLSAIDAPRFDVVLISLGVNDALSATSAARWLRETQALVETLSERFAPGLLLLTQLPPLARFPDLPWPLSAHLGRRADHFNRLLGQWVADQPGLGLLDLTRGHTLSLEHLAPDRFHPGEPTHRHWAELAAARIRAHQEALPPAQ
ncbi:SGNH/GDSL hydrolase family protein [Ferrimonas balearica]|uniref:SGNH/GDSL hydrolase family protein n=1 Tax=Ferrimonas balearica TaxID=44012 RepID=UPI001C993AE3|nr:SGNH/GDSL hydrolase family protein [Ferrimonas balearica]MBY5993903.1 SGNH/GDSL hydrolase family protein [Ferrimonas balearica]